MASSIGTFDTNNQVEQPQNNTFALITLTTLFFMWGFITCLNDILIPYLKNAFSLTYTQAMLVQFCFFGAYFIVSIPAGTLVSKIGFKKGIITGLTIASLGCFLFYPAAALGVYALFLGALFVLAAGITVLQVSANPFVSALGPAKTASSRLTMTQAFNSLGTTVAPFFGAWLIFSETNAAAQTDATAVQIPYLFLALTLLALAVVFAFIKLPELGKSEQSKPSIKTALKYTHLKLGAIGIFLYVGAEVAIGSFLVNFLHDPNIAGLNEAQAAKLIAYYWGGAMIGRFIGAVVMQKIAAGKVLAFNAVMAIVLLVVAVMSEGAVAKWSILAVGLFNSIMFPTIFSLAINKLGDAASHGAGLLCLAIVGGAIVPLFQGMLADVVGVQLSFLLPALCYVFIGYFGLKGHKPVNSSSER
ncbi:sugar MFS transporter [Pseudoalteromonas phenolica]|uniref:Glucose/galactose transporter family protein n=1 Tax=Pseudoalteromonas phenolica TaxID=161398 RepID=A0A0S2K3F6_9GAMM|nr:sugar MFS transporter [Pseudoalteromonas phenolica]ALO42606.1 Glucose/galactose transporter family protein [Pseudoalteromonas phenolica]MBE0356289.1 MFS transporter, FHS family, L-fucose permease [Pseudoalteromonas phenolica O-BC30]